MKLNTITKRSRARSTSDYKIKEKIIIKYVKCVPAVIKILIHFQIAPRTLLAVCTQLEMNNAKWSLKQFTKHKLQHLTTKFLSAHVVTILSID